MRSVTDFVLTHLPAARATVLEVGCGEGELARALHARGYDVTAIDPAAPEGEIFRRIKLEDVEEDARFDAVVASRSFHHMTNLDQSVEKVAQMTPLLVLDEFAWDRLDDRTAAWYERHAPQPGCPRARVWSEHHADVHGFDALRAALDAAFDEAQFEWVPYLWRYLGGVGADAEEAAIDAGEIQALGFRFVGISRLASSLDHA